ncbi:TetR/AcrR family transcriptional regulator [Calderihabitans maritimus]|uniref:Transcriptional regulator n=1 Tax=Calderihabitans maritimus TaxID=1246530 RepID=A0A1Z5HPB7_9FIRM|nr:TetR/AcrR family transcriptional regulator [Calderihabitans maritimus]GAW91376.1 transcriptional regulator [Calderihabitans maritimus]
MCAKKRDTRKIILDAALKLFSEKGFSATTTREIAYEARCAEGTIFRYFPTKKDILISLARPVALHGLKQVFEDLPETNDETVLQNIMENRLKVISENMKLLKVIITEAQFHEEIRKEVYENIGAEILGALAGYIEKRIAKGIFRPLDSVIAARIFGGMFLSFLISKYMLPPEKFDEEDQKVYLQEIVNIFLHGVVKKEGDNT